MSSDSDDFVQFSRRKQDLSCMAERLRERRGKKPVYRDPDEEDEEEEYKPHGGSQKRQRDRNGSDARRSLKTSKTKIDDVSCAVCGGDEDNGILHACDSCSLSCHLDCMTPPRKVPPQGKWTCAECVHPFSNIEKILDCQVRSLNSTNDEEESPEASAVKSAKHYLVKWKDMSYLHYSWHPIDEFEKVFKAFPGIKTKIKKFHQQMDSLNSSEEDWVPIRSEWTTVEKVIACRMNGQVKEYFVKWKELSYEECTWEVEDDISAFGEEIDKFVAIESKEKSLAQRKRKGLTSDGRDAKRRRKEFEQYDQTPEFLPGGTLHPYQLEGLNFLRFAWRNETHVILADEMGLGKTVQSIAFLASLNEENASDPHLVVAPLSTLRNWQREFSLWAPHMNVVMYVGSGQARSVIREYEFYFPKKSVQLKKKKGKKKFVSSSNDSLQQRIKFDVLLTSYEMINLDTAVLKKIKWECMIIDEGHRLKNKDSKLFQTLKLLAAKHRVLLTGTPLQNNLEELFMLMHFLDAGKFASVEEFQQEFKDISQEEQVLRLHKMLAPHLLRRVKKDVIKDLPPKKELILRVELSSMQKEYYKSILTRNFEILARRGVSQISLTNVVMQLRKVCAHPYMLEGVEPMNTNPQESFRQLLDASGKLYLLDKMMVKLKDRGHRVLIYSQFKNMLDILEDYLIYKSWSYERIDGSISGVDRQIRIDRFNAPNSTKFCFILSTRAGGLGINLATADTVIIYDSDWNPHADLQAMARAHRLGQTNKVMIFRLVTRGTIDERMMQMTKKKMILEHVVVGRMKNQVLNQEELDDILRYGAQDLFAEENDEASKSRQIHYDDAAIDRLLDRSQVVNEEALPDEEEDSDFLKAFKVANFEYLDEQEAEAARAEEARRQAELSSQQSSAAERAQYWEELLKDKYQEKQVETLSEFGKGKRSRKQVVCAEDDGSDGSVEISSDDEYDIREADWAEAEASGSGRGLSDGGGKRSQGSRKRARVLTVNALDPPPLMEGEGKSFKVLGFTQSQRATFLQILMRFGLGDFDWSDFYPRMRQKTPEEINRYGTLFLTHIAEDLNDSAMFSDGVPKEGLRIQDVLVRLAILHLIRDKVKSSADKPGIPLFRHDIYSKYPPLNTSKYWKEEYDCRLLQAILKHGYGKWHAIAEDHDCGFQEVIKQELQIPVSGTLPFVTANGFASSENKDATIQEEVQHVPLEAQVKSSIAETVEETRLPVDERGAQLNQFIASENDFYQLKDIQRRVVEFIRKRVLLLEKALNTEYHTQSIAEYQEIDSVNEDLEHLPNEADAESPSNQLHPECTLVNLPVTPLISPEELLTHSVDSALNRLEAVRLYNEMCKLTNENEKDFHHTQNGSKSAALKLKKYFRSLNNLADEVQKLLRDQQPSEQNVVTDHSVIQHNNHSDAVNGVKCNGDKECISPTDNANYSNLKPSTCSEISDRDIMGTNSNGFDSVAPTMLGVDIAKENGQEFCENETSTGLLKTNPNVNSSFPPMKEDEENVSLHTTTKEWADRVIVLDD